MQRAIRVSPYLSVIVTFQKNTETQLTSTGTSEVQTIQATIWDAEGLDFISGGIAIRQPEDLPNDVVGTKLALARALKSSTLTKDERATVYRTLLNVAEKPTASPYAEQIEKLRQDLLNRFADARQAARPVPAYNQGYTPYVTSGPASPDSTGYSELPRRSAGW